VKKISLTLALLSVLLTPTTTIAKDSFSTGGGYFEFGGHIGIKYKHAIDDTHSLSAAVGLLGYSLGYEYTLSEKMTAGLTMGQQVTIASDGYLVGKMNYHFQGVDTASWIVGVSAGVKESDGDCFIFCETEDTEQIESTVGIHFGYQF
jgi:hypothetical protein